jgi:capsid protein
MGAALALPRGTVLDAAGTPLRPSASHGRHVRRHGATAKGQLVNWINQVVGARVAEREKRVVSDRAADLYVNSAIAKGVIDGVVTEMVGTGLTPLPAPMLEHLGLGNDWSEEWSAACESLFERWGFDPRHWCDHTRRMNAYQLQALAAFYWHLDGIALFQVRFTRDPLRPSGLSLLPIDPTRLQTPQGKEHSAAEIYDGVEVDAEGAPVAVHITRPSPAGTYSKTGGASVRVPLWHAETGLPQVLLVCDVRNVAEYRQDSLLSSVIPEIKTNDDLVEAALIRTMLLNLFTLYVSQETPGAGFPGITAPMAGTGSADPQQVDWAQRVYELSKGLVLEGPPGYKPEPIENSAPGPGFSDMWRSIISRVGMATQRGSENVLREYNASYSASLASIENAERFSELGRCVLNSTYNQPVHSWLLYERFLAGELPVPARYTRERFLRELYAFTRAEWLPPPARVIRPDVQAKANQVNLETGADTLPDIYARRGLKWREQRRKTAQVKAYDLRLEREFPGISMTDAPPAPEPPTGRGPDDEDEPIDGADEEETIDAP